MNSDNNVKTASIQNFWSFLDKYEIKILNQFG